jgi:hypothetical protein
MINNSFHPHVWFKKSGDIFRKNIVLTEYKDIRLDGWGEEVDYNFFPNKEALIKSQNNGNDKHSIYGNPGFINSREGNFTLRGDSPAFELGFVNFSMDEFGVKKKHLKEMAKTPEIPVIWSLTENNNDDSLTIKLLGATVKNIETIEERSASGLNKTEGVLILEIEGGSIMEIGKMQVGDVFVYGEGMEIKSIPDLMSIYQGNNWKGQLNLKIIRNQEIMDITFKTK